MYWILINTYFIQQAGYENIWIKEKIVKKITEKWDMFSIRKLFYNYEHYGKDAHVEICMVVVVVPRGLLRLFFDTYERKNVITCTMYIYHDSFHSYSMK